MSKGILKTVSIKGEKERVGGGLLSLRHERPLTETKVWEHDKNGPNTARLSLPPPGNSATEKVGLQRRGIGFVRIQRTAGMSSKRFALSQDGNTEAPAGNERRRVACQIT